jgi:hypothetical protein
MSLSHPDIISLQISSVRELETYIRLSDIVEFIGNVLACRIWTSDSFAVSICGSLSGFRTSLTNAATTESYDWLTGGTFVYSGYGEEKSVKDESCIMHFE